MSLVSEVRVLPALELTFPAGLPGMSQLRRLRVEPLGDRLNVFGRLFSDEPVELGGHEVEGLSLVVAAPGLLWPDYLVEVSDEVTALLALDDPRDAVALVVVSVAERLEDCTANLFAPIVLNLRSRLAAQVVPSRTEAEVGWAISAPLPIETAA